MSDVQRSGVREGVEIKASKQWTIKELIHWTTTHFQAKKIESARLDAELLLAHSLQCRRLDLYLNFEKPLATEELARFRSFVQRRSAFEPIAYIVGSQEFYGRKFHVGSGVLVPRPETELLVEEVLDWCKAEGREGLKIRLLDVGSGSGCIATTLALEIPCVYAHAVDISASSEKFVKLNKELHGFNERLVFEKIDFAEFKSAEKFDVIVSNPPYISLRQRSTLPSDVKDHEPPEALFGGEEGSEILVAWLPSMLANLREGGLIACEIGSEQASVFSEIFEKTSLLKDIRLREDMSGHKRVIRGIKING